MDTRKEENELHLLGGSTVYKQDYAPEVLEAFTNKHQENDYWVRFNCPEFTSLCPALNMKSWPNNGFSTIIRNKKGTHCLFPHSTLTCI